MKARIYIYGILLIIIIVYVGACRKAGEWLVKKDDLVHADAIVILMGSIADRVLEASDQYTQRKTGKVIMVEANMGAYKALESRGVHIISETAKARKALVDLGIPIDSIVILPGDATSTLMEAKIIREYLKDKPNIDTLLLVSSAPHTLRASMIFKSAFRKTGLPLCILCSPSTYTNFNAEKWWRSEEDIQVVLLEYLKIANFVLFEKRQLK
jgi:uncharacterized SAM-binding protein YcdF (DUF218 family)